MGLAYIKYNRLYGSLSMDFYLYDFVNQTIYITLVMTFPWDSGKTAYIFYLYQNTCLLDSSANKHVSA